jgi:hypothetical protein
MLKQYPFFLLTALFLFAPYTTGGQTGPVVMDSVRLGKAPKTDAKKIWKVFGGQPTNVSFVVYGDAKERIDIQADLFQSASGNIATPIKKDIPVVSDLDFSRREQYQIAFLLQLPIVERASDFYLRCRFRSSSEAQWQNIGSVNIRIYPDDILKPVQALAEKNRIYLYGEGSILRSFLKDKEIRFEDRKDSFPKAEGNPGLILAEYIDKDWFALPKELPSNQAVVVFYPSHNNLPRIIVKQAGKGIQIEVKMSLLDELATNPEAQEFFGEIIDIALNHMTAATN